MRRDGITAPEQPDAIALEARRDGLYQRLEQGYARIERGLAEGGDTATWEGFWRDLLAEYDRVCDELQRELAV